MVLACIGISCFFLALESPIKAYSIISSQKAQMAEYALFGVFCVEFLAKWLDKGLIRHPEAYFRKGWNILDFGILLCQMLELGGLSGFSSLRVLRVLRPLRLFNKVRSLQLLIRTIATSWIDCVNVIMLWSFAFLLFSILGTSLFAGQLYACNDDGAGTDVVFASVDCPAASVPPTREWYHGQGQPFQCDPRTQKRLAPPIITRTQCAGNFLSSYARGRERLYYGYKGSGTEILLPRSWDNPGYSFDNFLHSFQALVKMISLEQWSEVGMCNVLVLSLLK